MGRGLLSVRFSPSLGFDPVGSQHVLIIATLLLATAPPILSDQDLLRQSKRPLDKAKKIGRREVLGTHNRVPVVAVYRCGDVCPAYTTRIIHYDLSTGPDCAKHGGVVDYRWVPMAAAVGKQAFCVPSALADRSTAK